MLHPEIAAGNHHDPPSYLLSVLKRLVRPVSGYGDLRSQPVIRDHLRQRLRQPKAGMGLSGSSPVPADNCNGVEFRISTMRDA
jgi:hypothetical protein